MLDPMQMGVIRDSIRYKPEYKLDSIKSDLMMNGEWQAIEEINREKMRRANIRAEEDAIAREMATSKADFSSNFSNFNSKDDENPENTCENCGENISDSSDTLCTDCQLTLTSEECETCGSKQIDSKMLGHPICIPCALEDYYE